MMKKTLLLAGGVILGLSLQAQTELPNPVYTLDFEGVTTVSDLGEGAELVGEGVFVQSADKNFGTYYQNKPTATEFTRHGNYLIVPTEGFAAAQAKETGEFTLAFWVNGYVANANMAAVNHYFSSLISAYSSVSSYKTWSWPMFNVRTRGNLQINCDGWSDYTDGENVAGTIKQDNSWILTKQVETGEVDEEENPIMKDTEFDENWHYVALVFSGVNAKYYVDGVIWNEWNATNNSYEFPKHMQSLDQLYLGDGTCWDWNDPDGAYAFDDIAMYAQALTLDQIELLMNLKRGNLTEDQELVVARDRLEAAIGELEDYYFEFDESYTSLSNELDAWLEEEIGDAKDYDNVDAINAAILKIQAKQSEARTVVNAHKAALAKIASYKELGTATDYAGLGDFQTALATAEAAIADPTTTAVIAEALEQLEAAKVVYVFTQAGDVKDVTRVIDKPWFIDEAYEPTTDGEGNLVFADDADSYLAQGSWVLSNSDNLRGNTDLHVFFTNNRPTANLWHNSAVAGGVLDVQQTLSNLPAGYYDVTADFSSSSEPTDNHVYAISGGVTKVSAPAESLGSWYESKTPGGVWVSLTSDKVLVGEDGTLTIGAAATTDGTPYKGWFCVTNFQLKYYGMEYDLSGDLAAKKTEATEAIAKLSLKGDKAAAQAKYDAIVDGAAADYEKVSSLTDLVAEVNGIAAEEQAFTRLDDIEVLATAAENATVKAVYTNGAKDIKAALEADDATVETLEGLEKLYAAYVSYVPAVQAAMEWGTSVVSALVTTQVADLSGATVETLDENQQALVAAMKASITEFEASEAAPKDITALVGNASFDSDLKDAWTVTTDGGSTAVSQAEVEFYDNTKFDISQVITDLPKGTYLLAASGFYRDGNNYADIVSNYWTKLGEESDSTVYDTRANVTLYAVSETFSRGTKLVSVASDSVAYGAEDDDSYLDYYGNVNQVSNFYTTNDKTAEPVVYYPYWMWDAFDMITNRGKYAGNEVAFVISEEKQDVTIGAVKTGHIGGDWTILDNFRLYYLGQEIPVAIDEVADTDKAGAGVSANGKYLENGRIVIVKNGVKYNVAGQVVK